MRLMKVSDKRTFCYCKVKSLKTISVNRKAQIKPGDFVYVMLYPMNKWHLFNTSEEDATKQYELETDAKIGIDFEDITENTTQKENP